MKTNNTPATMNANEINARRAANEFVNAPTHRVNTVDKYGNESSAPAWGLDMAESIAANKRATFPSDKTEIVATGATEYATETTAPGFSELSHAENPDVLYRVTATASGIYSDFTDRYIAEKELQNLINNGKAATLIEIAQ